MTEISVLFHSLSSRLFGKKWTIELLMTENTFAKLKDKWLHYFASILLENNLYNFKDFRSIVDTLNL